MSTEPPVEVLLPETAVPDGQGRRPVSQRRFAWKRLACAFAVAALADGVSVFATLAPPVQWLVDGVTALALFVVLGWQWVLLPGLILEAIPGLYIFPFWVAVVGAIALLGSVRPKQNGAKSE